MSIFNFDLQIAAKKPIVKQNSQKSDDSQKSDERILASLSNKHHQRLNLSVGASHARRRAAQTGFTLMEMAMVIAIVGILSAFALVSFGNADESRDATMIQAAQGSLQSIVSQGSIRMDQPPSQLDPIMVLNALRSVLNQSSDTQGGGIRASASGSVYTINIPQKNRSATFIVASNGDVQLTGLSNFTSYSVDKSRTPWTIKKGN